MLEKIKVYKINNECKRVFNGCNTNVINTTNNEYEFYINGYTLKLTINNISNHTLLESIVELEKQLNEKIIEFIKLVDNINEC